MRSNKTTEIVFKPSPCCLAAASPAVYDLSPDDALMIVVYDVHSLNNRDSDWCSSDCVFPKKFGWTTVSERAPKGI